MGPGGGFPYGDWERDIQAISDWLVAEALGRVQVRPLLAGLCDALNAAGLPVLRAISALSTLHPMYVAHTYTYVRGRGNVTSDIPHGEHNTDAWQKSPLKVMFDTDVTECRFDLTDDKLVAPYPLLGEARDLGGTDYVGFLTPFVTGVDVPDSVHDLDGLMTSWVTDRPEGFAAKHLRALRRLVPRFALAAKLAKREETALNIVTAYMGRDAGCRVLNGQIKLGEDGGYSPEDACAKALAAAGRAEEKLEKINAERRAEGHPELDFGLGLHVGEVMYGNIGVPARVEFSVTGPAANEVARLENLTKETGNRVVVSARFSRHLDVDWRSLGAYRLRGVSGEQEVFAPPKAG